MHLQKNLNNEIQREAGIVDNEIKKKLYKRVYRKVSKVAT